MTEAAMAKKQKGRRKPYTPPTTWDTGPDTALQRQNKVIEPATWTDPETGEKRNPNGIKRARRVDLVEVYHRRGHLSSRAFDAAEKLRSAWEATMKSAPAIKKVQVDTFPKPDAHIAIIIDRMSRYHGVAGYVPTDRWALVAHVVIDNRAIGTFPGYRGRRHEKGQARLAESLEMLADELGC